MEVKTPSPFHPIDVTSLPKVKTKKRMLFSDDEGSTKGTPTRTPSLLQEELVYFTPQRKVEVPLERSLTVVKTHLMTPPKAYQKMKNDSPDTKGAKNFAAVYNFKTTPEKADQIVIKTLKCRDKETQNSIKALNAPDIIYRWKVKKLFDSCNKYAGEAHKLDTRVASYLSGFRNPKKNTFYKEARENIGNGEEVNFGIIYKNVPPKFRVSLEKLVIQDLKNSGQPLYNKRNGGGGQKERKILDTADLKTIVRAYKKIADLNSRNELEASFPFGISFFRNKNDKIAVHDHLDMLKTSAVVYDYYDTKTKKHYIGKTINRAGSRVRTELTRANKGENSASYHKALVKRPHDFRYRIIHQVKPEQAHILEAIEHAYIIALRSHEKDKGYNNTKSFSLSGKNATLLVNETPKNKKLLNQIHAIEKCIIAKIPVEK